MRLRDHLEEVLQAWVDDLQVDHLAGLLVVLASFALGHPGHLERPDHPDHLAAAASSSFAFQASCQGRAFLVASLLDHPLLPALEALLRRAFLVSQEQGRLACRAEPSELHQAKERCLQQHPILVGEVRSSLSKVWIRVPERVLLKIAHRTVARFLDAFCRGCVVFCLLANRGSKIHRSNRSNTSAFGNYHSLK